ncbi:MAG: flap endonuclease-1 [Candidatus Nanoarchaeia archaeon]|jgi:flap endonuclease-1|nr:flap endonuclease-1 [Candidatus Nanoarchaeia archaeon]|tara:strand:- start:26464 stop:27486 length:1023 start_codon:yes stop_codon:yes gene_type:complete
MGVKLGDLITRKEISFDDLANKKIAIDAPNMLYQFLSSIRQRDGTPLMDSNGHVTSHLQGIFSRLSNLMSRNVKFCVCFDGKPPLLKIKEVESREHRKVLAEEKLEKAKDEEDIDSMYKYSKQTIRLTRDIINESKELIDYLGIPVIQAPSESDAQIAFMCEKGDVWACASSDMDVLIYGAKRLITNLTLSQRKKLPGGSTISIKPEMIELKNILKNLKLKQDQLLALAILVGTDYNRSGVKGIGPKTALKIVQQHKSFNKIFKEVEAEFNWKEVYAIFKSMPIMKNYKLKWKDPDEEKILKLLVDKHDFSEERIKKTLDKLNILKQKQSQKGLGDFINV